MFGYLRFFLAFIVALSHIGVKFYGLNPGVIAVVIFYILAGFVVSHLLKDIFVVNTTTPLKQNILPFYKDRINRIFPLYLYVITITTLFLLLTSYANPSFTPFNILTNLSIIPLNYYMYLDNTVLTEPNWWLVPPAWSLGTELQAYLLLPFTLLFRNLKIFSLIVSITIYMLANLTIIHTDHFGYRFIVGVFFIFLLGSAIQSDKKTDRYYIVLIWLSAIILTPLSLYTDSFSHIYSKETFIGLLIGIPLVYTLSHTKIKLPYNKILGSLSYGIFLTHFLAIWILAYLEIKSHITLTYILQLSTISLALSYIGVKLTEPTQTKHFRIKIQ